MFVIMSINSNHETVMNQTTPQKPQRRTQAERRAATKKRLIDATIDTLVASGYHGTTVKEICRRAGLSQGALFCMFRNRAELIVETLREINARTLQRFVADFQVPDGPDQLIDQVLNLIERIAQAPESHARREIWSALRTDEQLQQCLTSVPLFDREHERNLIRSAVATVPGLKVEPEAALAALKLAFRYFESMAAISPIVDVDEEAASVRSLLKVLAEQHVGIREPEGSKGSVS
ncbi:MAG: TetR/AcrR family transcriptional regulator [Candidatus Zixiibacteriota bacterium]|nr:MAG: TetR/AcrR family transcriptional regulator [candidate division Zixibacteria bacterium]